MSRRPATPESLSANVQERILVVENSPRWFPELQRQFRDSSIQVTGCRKLAELRERAISIERTAVKCVVVLDMHDRGGECLPVINWLSQRHIPAIIPGPNSFELLEASLREIGAVSIVLPGVTARELAERCRLTIQHQCRS